MPPLQFEQAKLLTPAIFMTELDKLFRAAPADNSWPQMDAARNEWLAYRKRKRTGCGSCQDTKHVMPLFRLFSQLCNQPDTVSIWYELFPDKSQMLVDGGVVNRIPLPNPTDSVEI